MADALFQGRTEEKLKNHERRLTALENMNESLYKLTASVEQQVALNKEQQGTLVEMNKNLTGLNTNLETLDQRVEKLETSDSERNIDMGKLLKDVVYKVIPSVVIAWLLFHFGLK